MAKTKFCTKCEEVLPQSSFYNRSDRKNARLAWCKTCRRNYGWYRYREERKEAEAAYHRKYPERQKAKDAVNRAVRRGELPRIGTLRCADCSRSAKHYHHESYAQDKWLEVTPLCQRCHTARRETVE